MNDADPYDAALALNSTRDDSSTPGLSARAAIANKYDADLYVPLP